MEIKLMPEDELKALLLKVPSLTIENKMKLYLRLRVGKAAITKHLEAVEGQYKLVMETISNHMLADADKQTVTGFNVKGVGTSYTAETKKISIADDASFRTFVLEKADLDFFERRVSSTHVDEYMKLNEGVAPPGLNIFRERVMRVRKDGEKV